MRRSRLPCLRRSRRALLPSGGGRSPRGGRLESTRHAWLDARRRLREADRNDGRGRFAPVRDSPVSEALERGAGKRAFVTGGAGFVGQWLARALLAEGWRVVALASTRRSPASLHLTRWPRCSGCTATSAMATRYRRH